MRKLFAVLPAVALAAVLFAQGPVVPKVVPKVAPKVAPETPRKAGEFAIHMPGGAPDKLLSAYKGKLVVMAFMHTTCPHCQHAAGLLSKIQADYAAKGVQVLGVTFDQNAQRDVATFDKVFATGFPCGWAPEEQVLRFLGSPPQYYIPMMAFIDATGTVRSEYLPDGAGNAGDKFVGDDEDSNIRKEIDKFLKAAAPAAKQAPKS